jgi:CSLREA domain-containing protein
MKSISRMLVVGLIAVAVPTLSPIPASAATFTVNSTADSADATVGDAVCDAGGGVCTLRAAIEEANADSDEDTIMFAELSTDTIQPGSALPNIIRTVFIIGTEPDGDRIELDGTLAGATTNGLTLSTADNSTISGLVINRFGGDGIEFGSTATENLVENTYIGTDVTGAVNLGNLGNGIEIRGHTNTVGGSAASSANLISGNQGSGVVIRSGASENLLEGNLIGTDVTGMAPLPNTTHGVVLDSLAHDNFIGSTTAGGRNVISGNTQDGVRVQTSGTTENIIEGNLIGTSVNGTDPLPNAQDGVGIRTSASGNIIGGTAAGAGNVISGNTDDGIQVGSPADPTPTMNALLRNSILGNGALGIDLDPTNGLTPNDAGDTDTGSNNLQNFPVLTSAASSATMTTIAGTLNSEASKTYRLEFFSNDACDSSGNGEGKTFLGATSVTTDSSGNVSFTAPSLTGGVAGQVATATATDPDNNTSEFSACTTVVFDPTLPATPDTTPPTTPTTNAGPKFQKQRTFPVTWSTSTDTQTSPVRYDVRYRAAPYNSGFGGFVNWQTSITATTATIIGAPGTTYCFSARAVDGAGNASPYGTEGCTAVPVDNPTFKHRGKWGKKTGSGYYLNTFSRTKQQGATLTLPGVQAKALSIIVTKCRACGVIHVFFKGKMIRKINLRSKAAARQKLRFINLRTFGSVQTGTLRVRVASRGKLVIVEGLGVSAV